MITNLMYKLFNFFLSILLVLILFNCESPESEFEKTKKENTIEAYNNFIQKYPTDTLVNLATIQITRLEFEKFSEKPTLEELLKYIEKYPNSNYLDSAKQKLLTVNDYEGITMKAEIVEYTDVKNLMELFPQSLHLSETTKVFQTGPIGRKISTIGLSDFIKEYVSPPVVKISFCNNSDTMKEISIKSPMDFVIRLTEKKMISAKRMSARTPGFCFPPAEIIDWELIYQIPSKDYIEFGFLFTEAKKDDLIIFDSSFVEKIM